ncbi:hypothetical protein GOODEAATRI_033329 [Goodea atripinnis]|uniref:Uncharacterized protein n=1 Tax=Goodea atripinnis TaxID=208336 RepID=A0ABV0PTX8_9TELE
MTEATTLSAIEATTVGIYISRGTPNGDNNDVGVVIEGVVVLRDLDNVALASAMLFGLCYCLNLRYPQKLPYTFEVFQKIIMELDAAQLSKKVQSLKAKMHQ